MAQNNNNIAALALQIRANFEGNIWWPAENIEEQLADHWQETDLAVDIMAGTFYCRLASILYSYTILSHFSHRFGI